MQDHICLLCPNGCHLKIDATGEDGVQVQGNRCERGVDFVRTVQGDDACQTSVRGNMTAPGDEKLREIVALWGISFQKTCPSLIPAGSPERTLFRVVVEDVQGGRYVLSEVPVQARLAKLRIMRSLEFLDAKGLPRITPYRTDAEGQYLLEWEGGLWQLMPFIEGVPLNRDRYLYEGWRAAPLSQFLTDLREKSRDLPYFAFEEKFSIVRYIAALVCQIEKHAPDLLPRLGPTLAFLESDFMGIHDSLATGFCHGDYHPLNIIWGEADIRSVIDWEFSGMKPEIYDLANMVGCLGMEHPTSLTRDLVIGLIARLKAVGLYADLSWDHFLEFVVALRFAWLSEWLRKDDQEMIGLELDYMDLLIEHRDYLGQVWGL